MRTAFFVLVSACLLAGSVCSQEPCTDTIYATVFEDTVNVFHDGAFYNCCAEIASDFEIGDTTIDILEAETFPKGPCDCTCCFDLSLSISNVPSGVYWVHVWNEGKSELYGKVRVVVGAPPSGPAEISKIWQSDCLPLVEGTLPDIPPRAFGLDEPMPNPAIGRARIFYQLDEPGTVSVKVYDLLGRVASVLVEGDQPAGRHSLSWDGRSTNGARLPSGIYFIRLSSGSNAAVRKLIIPQ